MGAKSLLEGTVVGGYRLDERIGEGAMGTVYRARQLSLDRTVAIKILSAELTKDRDFVKSFLREARAAAKLNHPNVAQIYDAGQDGETFFFSMEYLPGGSLAGVLEKEGQLPLLTALRMARDAGQALAWAEEHGIVHRDIKPDNLLLTADGTVKVADLGIAVESGKGNAQGEARGGAGSPRYMAPEQALGKPIDHRADIYALGSTLYRMLAGKPPFEGRTAKEILQAKLSSEPPALEKLLPGIPREISGMVTCMLARNPDERYPSCAAMLQALEEALSLIERRKGKRKAESGDPEAEPSTVRSHAVRSSGLSIQMQMAMAVSMLVIMAVVAWVVVRSKSAAPVPGDGLVDSASSRTVAARSPDGSGAKDAAEGGAEEGAAPPLESTARRTPRHLEEPVENPRADTAPPEEAVNGGRVTGAGSTGSTGSTGNSGSTGNAGASAEALRELGVIVNEWRAGLLEPRQAIARVEEFREKRPECKEQADRSIAQIRDKLAESSREVVRTALKEEVAPLVSTLRYGEAAEVLERLLRSHPENASEIAAERRRLEESALKAWKKAEEEAEKTAAADNFAGARETLKTVAATLPESLRVQAAEALLRLEQEEGVYRERSALIAAAEGKCRDAVAAGKFDEASAQVAQVPESNGNSLSERLLARRRAVLAEEVRLCAEAWKRLVLGATRAAAGGEPLDLTFAEEPGAAYRLKGIEGATLSVQPAGGGKMDKRELVRVSSQGLLLLWSRGGEGDTGSEAPAAAVESMGLLLLHAQGPDRARELLLDARIGPEKQKAYAVRLEREQEGFVARGLAALREKLAALEQDLAGKKPASAKQAAEWEKLAEDASRLIAASRKSSSYSSLRDEMTSLFLRARTEALRVQVPQSLFHGKVKSYSKTSGSLELLYQPSEPEAIKDFIPVIAKTSRAELAGKTFKVRGELRLASGDPFRGRLGVSGSVPANGFSLQEPNINVALWTRDGDRVTGNRMLTVDEQTGGTDPLKPPTQKTDTAPGDYFAFGLGYRANFFGSATTYFGYGSGYLKVPGIKNVVPMPANALIAGVRGSPLHTFPDDECIWATGVVSKVKGAQSFKVLMSADSLTWIINGRRVPFQESTELDRLKGSGPAAGSVTIFTNNSVVHFVSLLVEGDLNPAWVEEALRREAENALKKVEPDYPFNKPSKKNLAGDEKEWEKMLEKGKKAGADETKKNKKE